MVTCLLPLVLAFPVQGAPAFEVQPFTVDGAYILESVVDHYDVGDELRKQSRDYVDRNSPDCFHAETGEERKWLADMKIGPYRDPARIPVAWRMLEDANRFRRTEWIRGSPTGGYQYTLAFHHEPPRDLPTFHTILTPDGEGFDWQEAPGKERVVQRYSHDGGIASIGNGVLSLRLFFENALHVQSKAKHVDPDGFSVSLDLRRVANCMEFHWALFPLEVYDVAGRVVLTWSGLSFPRTLTLEWRDMHDALLVRERATWRSEARMPDEYLFEHFLVGTSALAVRASISILPWRDPQSIGEWSPEAGDVILDDRFDFTVAYRVKEGGGLPSEDQVAQRAWEAKLARYARSVEGERAGPGTRTQEREVPQGLEVPWDTVTLGSYPLGTWRPVEFEITNRGEAEIGIGRIETSCGCVEARASRTRLGPGETCRLSAFQQAAALGPSVSPIRVLVAGPGKEERTLELQVRYDGLPVPQLDAPVYDLGTLAVGEERTLEFRARWSLEHELACELRHDGAAVALEHRIELTRDAEGGHYAGKLSFVVPERYGVSSVDLVARGKDPAGELREGSAPVFWECAPPVEGWPRCRIVLEGAQPAVLRLPHTRVLGTSGGEGLLEVRSENVPDGHAEVTFRAREPRIARELVHLTTSRGTVGVLVLVSGP